MRIVGMPGEIIEFGAKQIVVDGKPLSMPPELKGFTYGMGELKASSTNRKTKITLGTDEFFLHGDNTLSSYDSRFWSLSLRIK